MKRCFCFVCFFLFCFVKYSNSYIYIYIYIWVILLLVSIWNLLRYTCCCVDCSDQDIQYIVISNFYETNQLWILSKFSTGQCLITMYLFETNINWSLKCPIFYLSIFVYIRQEFQSAQFLRFFPRPVWLPPQYFPRNSVAFSEIWTIFDLEVASWLDFYIFLNSREFLLPPLPNLNRSVLLSETSNRTFYLFNRGRWNVLIFIPFIPNIFIIFWFS